MSAVEYVCPEPDCTTKDNPNGLPACEKCYELQQELDEAKAQWLEQEPFICKECGDGIVVTKAQCKNCNACGRFDN